MSRNIFVTLLLVLATFCLCTTSSAWVKSDDTSFEELGGKQTDAVIEDTLLFDATVFESNPSTNYGLSDFGYIGKNDYKEYTYWKYFDCPSGPVTEAYLWFYIVQNDNGMSSEQIIIRAPVSSWTEGDITWNNQPYGSSASNDTYPSSGVNMWDWYIATAAVQYQCGGGGTNYGIMGCHYSAQPTWTFIGFEVYEDGGSNRAYLEMVYTAVDLADFFAIGADGAINIFWSTSEEVDNLGWNVYRSEEKDGEYVKINEDIMPAYQYDYEFVDCDVQQGKMYYYKVEDVDLSGELTMHGPVYGILWENVEPVDGVAGDEGDTDGADDSDQGGSSNAGSSDPNEEDSEGGCGC